MSSILALDALALQSAKDLAQAQPQAKFLGNIAKAAAPIMPFVSMIPGVGQLAAGADAAAIGLFGGQGGGGGGGGGQGGGSPYLSALQAQALAQGNESVAKDLMNTASSKQNQALGDTLKTYQGLLAKYQDPAFSMLKNTQYIPLSGLQGVNAPQINSLFSGNASQVPQMGQAAGLNPYYLQVLQALTQPQINFGGYQGPGFGTGAAAPGAPAAPGAQQPPPAPMPKPGGTRTLPIIRRPPDPFAGFGAYAGAM